MPTCSQLFRMRREAGYGSAKDFAKEIHIPYSTYSRYERANEKPDCGIPMEAAWRIADKLGCSIDEVVGRRERGVERPVPDSSSKRIEKLSPLRRGMLLDYLEYLEYRDDKTR